MGFYLAIDQGGTKTDALVFTENGEILGIGDDRSIRTPGDHYAAKQAEFIRRGAGNALSAANIAPEHLSGIWGALNGADWDHEYPRLRKLIAEALMIRDAEITVINDCIGAMRGGTDDPRCGVLCVGSGLNCAVRNGVGGEIIYGYFIADCDQGGGALGNEAWRAALDAHTGLGPGTQITGELLRYYRKDDLESLYIAFTEGEIPLQHKEMAPLLMRAAECGDDVAGRIVEKLSGRLAQYVHQAMRKLNISGEPLTLVVSGGVTKGPGRVLIRAIESAVKALEPGVKCVSALYEPVAGTAMAGLDAIHGGRAPEEVMAVFRRDAERYGLLRKNALPV